MGQQIINNEEKGSHTNIELKDSICIEGFKCRMLSRLDFVKKINITEDKPENFAIIKNDQTRA